MTNTDTQFAGRFPDITVAAFNGNQSTLPNYQPSTSVLNTGMMSDIGRATIYAPDIQDNFYARFMKSPLSRGDSAMSMRIKEVNSYAYDPNASDQVLFNAPKPGVETNVAKKNLSRQIAVEINDYYLRQMVQTQEMIGDTEAAMMAVSNACYRDDMWVASKEYFSGSTRGAQATQMVTLTNPVGDTDAFANEMIETLWGATERDFAYKSTKYNASSFNTKSTGVHIALKKDVEYPTFKKFYAQTFNPQFLKVAQTIDYVDDFATPAGAPADAGELIGMVVDDRAFSITPMPETLRTTSFFNPARLSTAFYTTYEYAFQHDPFFNCKYIFAPQ